MDRGTGRNVIFLLGAGASVEAGVYTAEKITDILVNYCSYCSSEESVAIENLLKYIQVRIADYMQVRASDINFEYILGTLIELSKRQEYPVVPLLGDADSVVKKLEQKMPLTRVVDKLYAMLRELLLLQKPVDYLHPLKNFLKRPLDFFTLNYDLALETAFTNLNISYTTGHRKRGSELPIWDPSEFMNHPVRVFKLHGSIDWGQYYLFPPPPTRSEPYTDAINAAEDFINNYPERVLFNPFPIGEVKPPERAHGMVSLMNFGTRKELLYASSQFNTLFHFFLEALYRADFLVIAGYSFRDDKVNKMIEEAIITRKGGLHVVIVNPSLFWLENNDPMLWKYEQLKWSTGIPMTFGEALRDGTLIDTIETFVKGKEALDKKTYPLGGIEANDQAEAAEVKPNVENILKMWELLGDTIDLTYFRMRLIAPELRGLKECATESEATKVGNALMPLLRKVRDLCHHIRWVYKEMYLGGTYGEAYLENIKVEPKLTNDFSRIELVRKLLPTLERTVSYVSSLYGSVTEEFNCAVTDPHYGESMEAPNNISAAELVIRKTISTIYELVWILNDILKGAGYEEPFEMIAKHQAGEK